jgi:hypothetical protein
MMDSGKWLFSTTPKCNSAVSIEKSSLQDLEKSVNVKIRPYCSVFVDHIHYEFVFPEHGQEINFCLQLLQCLRQRILYKMPSLLPSKWILHHSGALSTLFFL